MIDTHCHLSSPRLCADFEAIIARAREAGLVGCITIGTGVNDERAERELKRAVPDFVHCAAGMDPFSCHRAADGFDAELETLSALLQTGDYCALGEIGLEYFHKLDPHPLQAERLERQLELAVTLDLPVVIHVRDAHEDMLSILAAHKQCRGVIHSFIGGPADAERYLALGWHLGFGGVVTYKPGSDLCRAVMATPADRLLLETDSPYLTPVPLRGKRCEPAYVVHTGRFIAELRGERYEALAAAATSNAIELFGLERG